MSLKYTMDCLNGAAKVDGPAAHWLYFGISVRHRRCAFPAIVAIHGLAPDLGVDIISPCDVRYAAEGSQFSVKVRNLCQFIYHLEEVDFGLAADVQTPRCPPKITGNHSLMRETAHSAAVFLLRMQSVWVSFRLSSPLSAQRSSPQR